MNALHLKEFNIIKGEENQYDYLYYVEKAEPPVICPQCMADTFTGQTSFKVHDTKWRDIKDLDSFGKRVVIRLNQKRYRCSFCGKTHWEVLDSVEMGDRITKRLKEHLKIQSLKFPFDELAEKLNVSDMTVKRAFDDYVKENVKYQQILAPRVLGIDEAHLNDVMRGVFTDIENRMLLEITKDNGKGTVKSFIKSMKDWKKIEVVTMDMCPHYRRAVHELIPKAFPVIDKFHVVKTVTKALNDTRIAFKNTLPEHEFKKLKYDRWLMLKNKEDIVKYTKKFEGKTPVERLMEYLEKYPVLAMAYKLKEDLRDIYNLSRDKKEATERFIAWKLSIPDNFYFFKGAHETLEDSTQLILNYFDHPYTNAFTESTNNLIKKVEKDGNGYTFDVLRIKCLYGTQATKRPAYGEMNFYAMTHALASYSEQPQLVKTTDYNNMIRGFGVKVDELLDIIDRGKFWR